MADRGDHHSPVPRVQRRDGHHDRHRQGDDRHSHQDDPASLLTLGTANTGFTASAEGTTTASRLFDATEIAGVSNGAYPINYAYQFMPDERPIVAISKFLRVRVTFSAAVNLLCWICWDE